MTALRSAGFNPKDYSGHSFRRGGCSHAFQLGVPAACIKLRGDWKSSACERYITIQDDTNVKIARILAAHTV